MTHAETQLFDSIQIAAMLGVNPVTVRKWRKKNKELGFIKHGPEYEFRGANVVYPADKFAAWCASVKIVNGVPCMNLPITANIPLPRQAVLETDDGE